MYSAISTCTHVLYSCTRLDWKIQVICENLGLVYYSSLLNRFPKCLFQVSGGCIDSGFSLTSRLVPPCSLILAWINGQDLICDPLFISSPTVPVIFPTFPVIFQILSSIFLFQEEVQLQSFKLHSSNRFYHCVQREKLQFCSVQLEKSFYYLMFTRPCSSKYLPLHQKHYYFFIFSWRQVLPIEEFSAICKEGSSKIAQLPFIAPCRGRDLNTGHLVQRLKVFGRFQNNVSIPKLIIMQTYIPTV